jgi:regulator of replication initiation timing
MVKTKTPTLDSVRKVKSGVTELVLQNQKLKKKCRKLKKKVAKLETTSKKSFRNDEVEKKRATTKALMDKKRTAAAFFTPGHLCGRLWNYSPCTYFDFVDCDRKVSKLTPHQQNIWKHTLSMVETLDILDDYFAVRFLRFIHNLPPALMSRHAKTIAAGFIHSSVKPELNKRVMQEKIGVSVPTISQVSRIINLI